MTISEYLGITGQKRSPEKRAEDYQRYKAAGKTRAYYQRKKAEDPLFNQKQHIKRKSANVNWQTIKGCRANFTYWRHIVEFVRNNDLSDQELIQSLSDGWWLTRRYKKEKSEEAKTIYRPRITNTVLTEQQIEELDNYALSHGLTSQHELIKSTVSYYGELREIDSREEDKEVDVYTVQQVDKDYSEDEKLHTTQPDPRIPTRRAILARRTSGKRS